MSYWSPFAFGSNFALSASAFGNWRELGRTTLGATSDSITVSSLPDRKYYMLLGHCLNSGLIDMNLRMNNDTATNYARRVSINGGAESTTGSTTAIQIDAGDDRPQFGVAFIMNESAQEKLCISKVITEEGSGSTVAPSRIEGVGKWANTSAAINRFDFFNSNTGDYTANSELVVLGWDPDVYVSLAGNFWQELVTVTLGASGDNLSTGTFTAKKYLIVEVFVKNTGGTIDAGYQFNNDTAGNYSRRGSQDGGADATATSQSSGLVTNAHSGTHYFTMFIINRSANDKMCIVHDISQITSGASQTPQRIEHYGKWANTSSQITEIDINNGGGGSYDVGSTIKVWGAD